MILAILRAQFLSMRFRVGKRRSGAVFSAITGLLFYVLWGFIAWVAMLFFSSPNQTALFVPALTGGLMLVMAYWQLAPVISASFGASLDLRKLLAYPIPHGKLFLVEVLLRVATCGEMAIILAGIAIGLLRNSAYGFRSAPEILSGFFLFAAMNILLSAGTRNWLERIFLKTKLREVTVFLLVIIGLLPRLLLRGGARQTDLLRFGRFVPSQLVWPWSGAARLMLGDPVALSLLSAAAWLSAAFLFSRWQFEKSIRYDSTASSLGPAPRAGKRATADGWADSVFRLPARFLPDPIAALAEKELRTLSRIPRFRLVYAMSVCFGMVLYFPSMKRAHTDSFFIQNALLIMTAYGLLMLGQISYWNAFGFDRSAVQGYFSWPIRFRDVLIAKNVTVVLLLIPQIIMVSLIAAVAHIPVSPAKIAETIVVMFIVSLYWLSMGNICSVRIPRALDPDKMNQMSNKMQAMSILAAPFLLMPLVLAYWSRWFFESELVFAALILVAGGVGGVFYWVGLDSAANTANLRRESIVMELSRSEGPLSIT